MKESIIEIQEDSIKMLKEIVDIQKRENETLAKMVETLIQKN